MEETSIGEGVYAFQNMKAFLHSRQSCLFRPRPVFPTGNLEKWKAESQLVMGQAREISQMEVIVTESLRDKRYRFEETTSRTFQEQ